MTIITNHGCLHGAILKALYGIKEEKSHRGERDQFFFQNVQNWI